MFSAILAVALIGGGDVAALGHKGGGCSGGYSCMGGCYGGCYGCTGGGKHHGGRGCSGGYSCMGGCYGGCYGGCTGGKHHGRNRGGCNGGYSCCGYSCCGYTGCGYTGCGCMGYYGGGYGGFGGGCYGFGGVGGVVAPVTTIPATTTPTTTTPGKGHTEAAAPATIVVHVPADAKVTVDGEATTSTTARRIYVSPSLDAGQEFHYTLQAEFNQDGKTISVKKIVAVRAGQETEVDLNAADADGLASR